MYVYAGIDEAGYGPMFGPLLVARAVVTIPNVARDDLQGVPQLWQRLRRAACRSLQGAHGRIVINDSKKVHTPASGIKHLERGVLAFATMAGHRLGDLRDWLDWLGESCHHDLRHLPWYRAGDDRPWESLPGACTAGEIAVARNLLESTCKRIGVELASLGAAVVLEDRFNRMVAATRSKASTSFTFVAGHLQHIWDTYGEHDPMVAVDRQSGRSRYRELLALTFPEAEIRIVDEGHDRSVYQLHGSGRAMTVTFEVDADANHLPTALASMTAKYTRELMMARFQAWFANAAPDIKPTAGYAADAQRFWRELEPRIAELAIDPSLLVRMA
jgi:ribonuclease HII